MIRSTTNKHARSQTIRTAALAALALVSSACSHVQPPPASEFGFGPRVSSTGTYEAVIESPAPLRTRALQTVQLTVTRDDQPVENAVITVDGGMPQHGHGLPTQPKVTRSLGNGKYQVEGVRFNMGGWWELRFRIASAAGADSVTFNLDL